MPYGKQSRAIRRLFSSKYSSPAAQQLFYDSHRASMGRFLQHVVRDPEGFSEHLKLRSGQLIIDVTYGIVIENVEDRLLKTTEAVMDVASVALSPPMWLMNPSAISTFLSSALIIASAGLINSYSAVHSEVARGICGVAPAAALAPGCRRPAERRVLYLQRATCTCHPSARPGEQALT